MYVQDFIWGAFALEKTEVTKAHLHVYMKEQENNVLYEQYNYIYMYIIHNDRSPCVHVHVGYDAVLWTHSCKELQSY